MKAIGAKNLRGNKSTGVDKMLPQTTFEYQFKALYIQEKGIIVEF